MEDHLRILFVIDTLGPGGKERRFTELLKALKAGGDISFELVIMSNDIHYTDILDYGIKIHRVIRKTAKDLSVFRKLWLIIKEYKPDAVHCWESMTAVYLAPVCKLLNRILINGMVTNVPLRRNLSNHHWRRARLTFPFSEYIVSNSKAGLRAYKVPVKKGVVIYNGFNFNRLENLIDKQVIRQEMSIRTDLIVGMVASFWKQKDYPTYYKAAQLVLDKRRDVTFLAVGPGTDSEESLSLIREEDTNNFRLVGKRSKIESIVNIMDVCVLSTFTEGTSNAILEYMAVGKPVVATEGGGTAEIVDEGKTGFLVEPSQADMLAEKIMILLDDRELCEEMGMRGRSRVLEYFSIDRMVSDYIELYKRVCN